MITEAQRIQEALKRHTSMPRLADPQIELALVPAGGDWECGAAPGAITRSIIWRRIEVALVNPRGDLDDATECSIAMGLRATPLMDRALRAISVLATDAENLELIRKIACTAVEVIERPAPPLSEPEERDVGDD